MAKLKVGSTVKITGTKTTGKVLKINRINGTAIVQTLDYVHEITIDLIEVVSSLQVLILMIRSIFKKNG